MNESFGTLSDGTPVERIVISDGSICAGILTYGAAIHSLQVKDRNNSDVDVVLGYADIRSYECNSGRMGAVIGRCANRIGDARFAIDGKEYILTVNRGQDHIHGGNRGFDKRVWSVVNQGPASVTLGIHADDGEEGYPGNIDVEVTYSVSDGCLNVEYTAFSDADTLCNLTNHAYFNLGGSGTIEDHEVTIDSDQYTDANERGIPTGRVLPVGNSRFDLREPTILGNRLPMGDYDHNYLLKKKGEFATVYCGRSGITMTVSTDMPALQFYCAGGLKEVEGKNGSTYGKWSGLCLETQFCPDSPNHDNFIPCILKSGIKYRHATSFRFSI